MIAPNYINKGDTIAIVATGRKIDAKSIFVSSDLLRKRGFNVQLGTNLFSEKHSYLSGSDQERLSDLQSALDDPSIHAVLFARGGYGTTRIIDQLDWKKFQKHPKWLCGFSDITALHLKTQSLGLQSIHSTMPILFPKSETQSSLDRLINILEGHQQPIETSPTKANRLGEAKGILIGGNLSLLVDSLSTPTEIETDGKILMIEEVDEYLYKIDRMIVQLKRAGKLNHLAGLVIGHMTDIKDTDLPFGETIEQIVLHHTKEFNYPIVFNFPFGHQNPNLAWVQGQASKLQVSDKGTILQPA